MGFLMMQVQDENSKSRQKRAEKLPKQSRTDFLSLLGDMADAKYPIYMTGNSIWIWTFLHLLFFLMFSLTILIFLSVFLIS